MKKNIFLLFRNHVRQTAMALKEPEYRIIISLGISLFLLLAMFSIWAFTIRNYVILESAGRR